MYGSYKLKPGANIFAYPLPKSANNNKAYELSKGIMDAAYSEV